MITKNNSKKRFKIIIYTLLVFGCIGLTSFSKTYSKFYDKNNNALTYGAQLYNLYYEHPLELTTATKSNAKFTFNFVRNRATLDENLDKYEISIPDSCEFDSIDTGGSTSAIDKSSHVHVITFGKNIASNYINRVKISCSINSNSGKLDYIVKLNETINDEKFIYAKYSYTQDYNDYIEQISKEHTSDPVSKEKIYESLRTWIKDYSTTTGYYDEMLAYVKSVFPDDNSIMNESNFNKLPGLSIQANADKTEYTFKITTNNFVGYARTYGQMQTPVSNDYKFVYFSSTSATELNEAFNNYLNWYIYPNDSQSAKLVYDYILDNGGISSIISGSKQIAGMDLVNGALRINKSILLSMAASYNDKTPQVAVGYKNSMDLAFANVLMAYYPNLNINVQVGIYDMVSNSVTKNSTEDTATTPEKRFKDYFIYQSGNIAYFIKVSSERSGYNTFNISQLPFDIPSDMVITSTNVSDTEFKITIKHATEASVNDIVTKFGEYFSAPTGDDKVKVISNTADEYIVEYTISK